MIIEVARVPPEGCRYDGEEAVACLDLDGEEEIEASEPLRYELEAQRAGWTLIVHGKVSTHVSFVCSRCAGVFRCEIAEPTFLRTFELKDGSEIVDLTPDMRESILLNFPAYPVCRSDCLGLCSQCGTNLNRGSCDCAAPDDKRWDALDGIGL